MPTLPRRLLLGGALGLLAGAARAEPPGPFVPPPSDPFAPPVVTRIPLPEMPGAEAIWGATGHDSQGRIWLGVSAGADGGTGHLCRHDPATGQTRVMGSVLANLARLRPLAPGEGQIKLHSRIIQAADGLLYFTSTDEQGEREDGMAPPRWGSHLWRTHPDSDRWEHLLAVPEGLTCAAGSGRWIYALGLWGHVLYRYDTETGAVARIAVGAPGGHMSRNFVVDARGHAYVPRVRVAPGGIAAELVEFDPDLRERAASPLQHYSGGPKPGDSHGITGLLTLADGSLLIASSTGFLHRITPGEGQAAATVRPLGWFDPGGAAYVSGLQSWDGGRLVAGMVDNAPGDRHWVVRDLHSGSARAVPFADGVGHWLLLYGSQTADRQGRFYLGGRTHDGPRLLPVLLRVG